jgi:metallophosphoesterase (TIGR03767 family)
VKSPPRNHSYRQLELGPGEPHIERYELVGEDADGTWTGQGDTLARLIHITDFQLADLASPSRVEFLQRLTGQPAWRRMLPAYRPQEFMLTQAIEAVVRTVRRESEKGGVDFVVTTGDNTDSAQENEVAAYLTLMNGGDVDPGLDNGGLAETVTCSGDPAYWNPEPASADIWKQEHGYPSYPGAVAAAARKFTGVGLGTPWLTCFGNHDCLVQGRARSRSGYDDFLTGNRKPVALPAEPYTGADALDDYCEDPLWVSQGPTMSIEASPARRMVSKKEYIEHHFRSTGAPEGHGFTAENLSSGTAYYAYDDVPGLRVISLDTTNPAGHVDGCVNEQQYRWLEDRLQEVHSEYLADDGTAERSGNDDRLVMICSHHGMSTMTNDTPQPDGERLYLAADVERLLHRYPNVVLWLSGHTHVNRITPRPHARGGGFWEVSTSSVAEWPVQLRTVHFTVVENAGVRIRTTMIDSAVPVTPTGGTDLGDLAALHREAAANDAGSVGGLDAEGEPEDRNVDLLVPLPASTLLGLSGLVRSADVSLGTNQ